MSTHIVVEGMSCEGCAETVEDALRSVSGVDEVSVDLAANAATVDGTPDTSAVVSAIEDAGYEATVE